MPYTTDREKITNLSGADFASNLLMDQDRSGANIKGQGEDPWETISYYIIELERRIHNLQKENTTSQP